MSGMSTALVNGVAGGLSQGVTTGDWKDSMVDSMRNSAASYLGGNLGGGNDALTNASSMLFRKMLGSKEDFSWDTVAKNDAIGKLVGDYLNDMLMSDQQKLKRAADEQKRQQEQGKTAQGLKLMNMFENTIGGFFSRLGKDMNALASDVGNAAAGVKSAWGSIKSGEAWENIKAGAATAWNGVKGAASWVKDKAVSAWNGVKNVASSVVNSVAGAVSTAVGAVGTFAEKTGNWFSGDGFNTDDEVVDIKLARYQELINNPVLMASNGDGNQAEMFAWKSASERANEMSQIAEKITPQQLEYAILRSGMSKDDAEKLRQMYSLDKGNEINTEENLNLKPGLRVNAGQAIGKPVLEIISYMERNVKSANNGQGVAGQQLFKLNMEDGTIVQFTTDRVSWKNDGENEHPTFETSGNDKYTLSKNNSSHLIMKSGVSKPHNEFYQYRISNTIEDDIFMHAGSRSEGCFITGGRFTKPDKNSNNFFSYIDKTLKSRTSIKVTHRIVDARSDRDKKNYKLPNKLFKKGK